MKFGLWLCSQYPLGDSLEEQFEHLIEQVRLAGRVGFDSIWTGHHYLMPTYRQFQPLPLLARLAGEAGHMAVGTSLTLVPLHHPVELAEVIATMDIIVRGRFIWGVGLGYRPEEFEAFGVPRRERAARFEESITLIRQLWTEQPVTHAGPFYPLRDAITHVQPVQKPHPPIWIGASSVPAAKRAARLGDGILLNIGATLSSMKEHMAAYRATLAEIGRSWPPVRTLARDIFIAPSDEEAWRLGGPILEARYRSYGQWGMDKDMSHADRLDLPLAELAPDRFIIGSPQTCRRELERYVQQLDVNYILLRVQSPHVSQATALRAIELLGREVFSSLRASTGSVHSAHDPH